MGRGIVAIAKGWGMRSKPKAVNPHEVRAEATVEYGVDEGVGIGWG
jgi:hypothetical protein